MRPFPNRPDPLARPLARSSRAVSIAEHATTTARAFARCSRPCSSRYTTERVRPASATTRVTRHFARSVRRRVCCAMARYVASVDDLAPTSHP